MVFASDRKLGCAHRDKETVLVMGLPILDGLCNDLVTEHLLIDDGNTVSEAV